MNEASPRRTPRASSSATRCNDGLIRRVDLVFEPNRGDSLAFDDRLLGQDDATTDAAWVNT
jgi:hypothetical protein